MSYSFGKALELLKEGRKVAREGWNGKNMFLIYVSGSSVKEAINTHYGNPKDPSSWLDVDSAIYMKTANNTLVPWLASQSDVLNDDWIIVNL